MVADPTKKILTEKQEKFRDLLIEYDGIDVGEPYRKAGYKVKTDYIARTRAEALIKDPVFLRSCKEAIRKISKKKGITIERLLEEESCLAFSDPVDLVDLETGVLIAPHLLPVRIRRAIASVEIITAPGKTTIYKYKFWDKGKALERLERHKGMFEKDNAQRGGDIYIGVANDKQIEEQAIDVKHESITIKKPIAITE